MATSEPWTCPACHHSVAPGEKCERELEYDDDGMLIVFPCAIRAFDEALMKSSAFLYEIT